MEIGAEVVRTVKNEIWKEAIESIWGEFFLCSYGLICPPAAAFFFSAPYLMSLDQIHSISVVFHSYKVQQFLFMLTSCLCPNYVQM